MRILHYGLFANRCKRENVRRCRELLGLSRELPEVVNQSVQEMMQKLTGKDITLCPCYGKGKCTRFAWYRKDLAPVDLKFCIHRVSDLHTDLDWLAAILIIQTAFLSPVTRLYGWLRHIVCQSSWKSNKRGVPKPGGIWLEITIIWLMQINLGILMPFFAYMN